MHVWTHLRVGHCGALLVALSLCTLVSWTPASAKTPNVAPANAFHSVGVISLIEDRAAVESVGITILTSKTSYAPLPDMAKQSSDDVLQALSTSYDAKPISVGADAFKEVRLDPLEGTFQFKDVTAAVKALPPQNVDAYLILIPFNAKRFRSQAAVMKGLGMERQQPFHDVWVHAIYCVVLADAKSGALIAARNAEIPNAKAPNKPAYPFIIENKPDWAETADALTDAQRAKLGDQVRTLMHTSIAFTIAKMGLGKAPT